MFGIVEYIAVGAVAVSVGVSGLYWAQNRALSVENERLIVSEAQARGALQTCSLRLVNIQEAAESNASIPDDLTDFDIPDSWLLPEGTDQPTD